MSSRPKRKSALEAIDKIREVLTWESCSESSEAFKAAAERMEIEFNNAKRRRIAKGLTTPNSTDDDSADDDHDEDDDSGSDDDGSAPSSSDLYSDPGSSSDEDDAELSDAKSDEDTTDVVLDVMSSPSAPVLGASP